ncbi:MAG TPA: PorP/SprF family type IX secretion system membrane protein [Chitinophagales bacterium]|nr:PorP/SprF family type IX secretion system membrane protein [Chitinophagales bacterium]
MMKFFTRLLLVVALLATVRTIQAQDIHFSQFYSQPLLLNPAMTGNLSEHYRVALTYRNQWASIPAPYSTVAAAIDASLLGCQLGSDHVGVGFAFYNDRSGDGILNDLSAMLSAAYHKGLTSDRRYMLSAGLQAAIKQKSINIQNLFFENQINSNLVFDGTLPNGEPFQSNRFSYFDLAGGAVLSGSPTDRANFYVGGAYYHFTKPKETFLVEEVLNVEPNLLDGRMVFHGGGSFMLGDQFSISPSALYMNQSASQEIVFGTAFGMNFTQGSRYRRTNSEDNTSLYIGSWYRWEDAIIFMMGVDFKGFRFGFSYDINISPLKQASNSQGGIELALSFAGRMAECKRRAPVYCPRF